MEEVLPRAAEQLYTAMFAPGAPHATTHLLATCATLYLAKGTNPKIVQEVLGHANISVTIDTYSHVLPDM